MIELTSGEPTEATLDRPHWTTMAAAAREILDWNLQELSRGPHQKAYLETPLCTQLSSQIIGPGEPK